MVGGSPTHPLTRSPKLCRVWAEPRVEAFIDDVQAPWLLAAEILGGRRITIRIEEHVLLIFDPETRELLRTRPNPLTYDQVRHLRGARPAGPPPRPSVEPVTVTRRVSATGTIMIARQLIALGRDQARTVVTAHLAEHTITVDLTDGAHRTYSRTSTGAIRNLKAHKTRTVS